MCGMLERSCPLLACPRCRGAQLIVSEENITCAAGDFSGEVLDGIPILLAEGAPTERYEADRTGPLGLLAEFGVMFNSETHADRLLGSTPPERCLSVGEGTGEYILALAAKHPAVDFWAIDLELQRLRRARALQDLLGIHNVTFLCADAEVLPFVDGSFDVVFERGTFHIVSDRERHLEELVRIGTSKLLLTEMANGRWFLRNWQLAAALSRATRRGEIDLKWPKLTHDHLLAVGALHGPAKFLEHLGRHGFESQVVWHDLWLRRSYTQEYHNVLARHSASFGLIATRAIGS